MRILCISGELIGSALLHRLTEEGHEVKLYIKDPQRRECLNGLVEKTLNWRRELSWVGTDGLIIFDDVIYGTTQDRLRRAGYRVVGGSAGGDRLELERQHAQEVLAEHGITTLPSYDFPTVEHAIEFVKQHPSTWVIKQNDHIGMFNFVGHDPKGADVISMLESYQSAYRGSIHLQRTVLGVEVGIGRYFNGRDWVGPVEINFEHKALHNGDIGPMTGEMGTLMWYDSDEQNRLFQATLAKLVPHLRAIDFRGDIDVGCIVNADGVWPLEFTARFGTPSTELQTELHTSPWGEFLSAVASGEAYDLKHKKGHKGVVVTMAVPPNPYPPAGLNRVSMKGTRLFFRRELSAEERRRIHFEEVARHPEHGHYYLAGRHGYVLYVTGSGKTVNDARQHAYNLIEAIHVPKAFYRTDIGERFVNREERQLKEWGFL